MRRLSLSLLLTILVMLPEAAALSQGPNQTISDADVEAVFSRMSPEARIGQLFVIDFQGNDTDKNSLTAQQLAQLHIGGVVLSIRNNNFTDDESVPVQLHNLSTALQTLVVEQSQLAHPNPEDQQFVPLPYVPLFVGLDIDTADILVNSPPGLAPVPSSMAIGATWNSEYAEQTGHVIGQELSALGINLLIGPSADVVEEPQPLTPGDLGTTEFGGDPFWVSRMTAAYVSGVHSGSQGRIAVFPRFFPGHGGADRVAEVEIPTIRRTRDYLVQSDLQPFFAVTEMNSDNSIIADGLLTGHIKYRGLQGDNPRLDTDPISLDQESLQALLSIQPLSDWRAHGGLIMSDALGVRGIRILYDPQGSNPNIYKRISQDALLAGNDLLYLGGFDGMSDTDQVAIINGTIDFFVSQYESDLAFQGRVNEAVRRIIRRKLTLYGTKQFDATGVLVPSDALAALPTQSDTTFAVAQQALTLLSPSRPDFTPPQSNDRIVIFTDTRSVRLCSSCVSHSIISRDAFQSAILKQYGPDATGLVSLGNVQSFSFEDLDRYLRGDVLPSNDNTGTPQPDEVGIAINSADWVLFVMLDIRPDIPSSFVVKQFLANPPVKSGTQLVVFAMAAPYYLDATEVSKLTAYYALYSSSRPFIEVAVRGLFLDLPAIGASPVSVSAINYRIGDATSPDSDQVITLFPDLNASGTPLPVTPSAPLAPQQGDTILIHTGVIVDQNGHPVPDGTSVDFAFNYRSQGFRDTSTEITLNGIAQTSLVWNTPGRVEITASSAPAMTSDTLIVEDIVIRKTPTFAPTVAPTPTEWTYTGDSNNAAGNPTPRGTFNPPPPSQTAVTFGDLYLALFGLIVIASSVFWYFYRAGDLNYSLMQTVPVLIGGLITYNYYALFLPGAPIWREFVGGRMAAALAAWLGGAIGLMLIATIAQGWVRIRDRELR